MTSQKDIGLQHLKVSMGQALDADLPFPVVFRPTIMDIIFIGIWIWHAATLHTFEGLSVVFFIAVLARLWGRLAICWNVRKKQRLPGMMDHLFYMGGTIVGFLFGIYEIWILWPR